VTCIDRMEFDDNGYILPGNKLGLFVVIPHFATIICNICPHFITNI
jgi:hypothetical protein